MEREKVILCWSSGKDSAWSLRALQQDERYEVVALLTTVTEEYDRVSMHGVRRELLKEQALAAGLPLWEARIPKVCTNDQYEEVMRVKVRQAREEGIHYMAFGDLFLEDIRDYRVKNLQNTGIAPLFPLWQRSTDELAQEMIHHGLRAVVTCVDTRKLGPEFCGREYDRQFIADLPQGTDPCGENGEFHTFAFDGPMFSNPIPIARGEQVQRGDFCFTDFGPLAT